jgi:serine/threonine-protein kinase RIO1
MLINNLNHSDSIKTYQADFEKLNKYFEKSNISLCDFYKSMDTIKNNAKNNANKKYPNEIAKHDKFIERYYEQHSRTFRNSNNIQDSISFKAYFIGKLFCK